MTISTTVNAIWNFLRSWNVDRMSSNKESVPDTKADIKFCATDDILQGVQ